VPETAAHRAFFPIGKKTGLMHSDRTRSVNAADDMIASMGIHVHLAVAAERVSDTAWQRIYDKARRVVKHWTPRPLSLAWRHIGAVRVAQYGLDLETPEGLHLVGDAETLTTGESFRFPARLDRAAPRRDQADPPATSDCDVLVAVARWRASAGVGHPTWRHPTWRDLLGAKTQGLPYHVLIVALGLLAESSLPGAAVVYGEISAHDGEQARRGLAAILGEELELPVVVDAKRLRQRLAASLNGDELDRAIRVLGPLDPGAEAIAGDLLGLLRRAPDARVRYELEHVVRSCPDPARLDIGTRQLVHRLIEAIRSTMARGELRERIEQWGTGRTHEALARRTQQIGMTLTSNAWDTIEIAYLDELAFLYAALCIATTHWEVRHAVRGLLENRALRRA
jgi:hypothetical protein